MKRIVIVIMFLTLVIPVTVKADETPDTLTASKVFADIPLSVLDLVDRSRRLDMLDYYAADSIAKVPNTMEGISYLDKVTPDYLKVMLTPVSEMTLKILPGKKEDIIMTAYTVGDKDQAYDTDLRFYDEEYQELEKKKIFREPSVEDFFRFPDKASRALVKELVTFPTVRYIPDVDGTGMTAELTVGQFLSADDYKKIKSFMKPGLKYKWNSSHYSLDK